MQKQHRSYKVEIIPNKKQLSSLFQHAGAARFVWNWALAKRIELYEETKKSTSAVAQSRELTQLKKNECTWLYNVHSCSLVDILFNLDKAYQSFFRRMKNGKPGFPKFKSKKNGKNSFTLKQSIHVYENRIKLPKIGLVKFRNKGYIPLHGIKILSVTCSEKNGRWYASVNCEKEVTTLTCPTGEPIGIDVGIKHLSVVSDGRIFENPKTLYKNQKKMRRLQRKLCRRKKGSRNRDKARKLISKLHEKISNIRKDNLHKTTSTIIYAKTKPTIIVLEKLNVNGMMKNHKLARAIGDASFAEFKRQITYKAGWNGIEIMEADRFYPSSKMCSECGTVNDKLTLNDREWVCESCGVCHDRDLNAAINLRNLAVRQGMSELVEQSTNACGDYVSPDLSGNGRKQELANDIS